MVLVNVSILPHGTMLLDLVMPDLPDGVAALNNACFLAGQTLVDSSPDTIILFTPHGLSIQTKPSVYLNRSVNGTAGWNGFWENYSTCAECDCPVSSELLTFLNTTEDAGAAGITSFSSGCAAPLAWGEVVPLQFCSSSLHSGTKVVVCSWPRRRFKPVSYARTAFAIGKRIQEFCVHHPKRIALLFSCDLSHVHGIRPDLGDMFRGDPELGVNKPLATQFDAQILSWVGHLLTGDHSGAKEVLLGEETMGIVEEAKSCGWAGFCAVQGLMETHAKYKASLSGSLVCVSSESADASASAASCAGTGNDDGSGNDGGSGGVGLFSPVVAEAENDVEDTVKPTTNTTTIPTTATTAPLAGGAAEESGVWWEGKLWGYGAPTYFGMMAVTFNIHN